MSIKIDLNTLPEVSELWAGIGGHFDSLGQIINEFIDNSISNFAGNPDLLIKNVIVSLEEQQSGSVFVRIEDSGTGIKDLSAAFTLGNRNSAESPLNEHGFGMKHALATANPSNNSWKIYTRTQEDINNGVYKYISAPYKIQGFQAELCNETWEGLLNSTGTIIQFICEPEMYYTIARGFRGGIRDFKRIADILCEDIGFVYAGVIKEGKANISLRIKDKSGNQYNSVVGALEPDWEEFFSPGSGVEEVDLGCGRVKIEYKFGSIKEKDTREAFNNDTAAKYYKRNMSSSGVEIRINGRVLCYNLFKEIWGIEKHNSYNYLLIILNLKSNNSDSLPKTRTSKNGLREGDIRLERLYEWIKSKCLLPQKDVSLSDHETDLFETLMSNKKTYNQDPNSIISVEQRVFVTTGDNQDKVRVDLYESSFGNIFIYEGKKEYTHSKDVYQLRMYWDGFVYDGIHPTKGFLVAKSHPDSVKRLIDIVNTMKDSTGNNYCFEIKTWRELGIIF